MTLFSTVNSHILKNNFFKKSKMYKQHIFQKALWLEKSIFDIWSNFGILTAILSLGSRMHRVISAERHTSNFRFEYEKVLGSTVDRTHLWFGENTAWDRSSDNFYFTLLNCMNFGENEQIKAQIFNFYKNIIRLYYSYFWSVQANVKFSTIHLNIKIWYI